MQLLERFPESLGDFMPHEADGRWAVLRMPTTNDAVFHGSRNMPEPLLFDLVFTEKSGLQRG